MSKVLVIIAVFCCPFLFSCGHLFKRTIDPKAIDSIVLVQVGHPYLGPRIRSIQLPAEQFGNFVDDFANKHEDLCKFYSCYVIKIFFKNGKFISYRTTGIVFEKFKDEDEKGGCFILNNDVNLITKYWGITKDEFCKSPK